MSVDDFAQANRTYWRSSFPDVPDMGQLIRHAEMYGSDSVYETAESYGYPLHQLLQLDAELTRIDSERRKRFGTVPTRRRPSSEDKAKAILYLTAEGVADGRIARSLGVSQGHVRNVRAKVKQAA